MADRAAYDASDHVRLEPRLASGAGTARFVPISGSGSRRSKNALDQWRRNVNSLYGITVHYASVGDGPKLVQQPMARVGRTPVPFIPAVGALFLVALVFGVLAAVSAPIMRPLGSRIARRLEKGVRPTER